MWLFDVDFHLNNSLTHGIRRQNIRNDRFHFPLFLFLMNARNLIKNIINCHNSSHIFVHFFLQFMTETGFPDGESNVVCEATEDWNWSEEFRRRKLNWEKIQLRTRTDWNSLRKMCSTLINMSRLVIGLQFMIFTFVAGQNELFSVSYFWLLLLF